VSSATGAPPRVAIVGGGWAGLAAAVRCVELGHRVTLFEAARTLGGRARRLESRSTRDTPSGASLDNGQHILIGAYTATLGLMQRLGVEPESVLHREPLALRFSDGSGLSMPRWADRLPPALGLGAAILLARGWDWRERGALLRASLRWRADGFRCPPDWTVDRLCIGLGPRVRQDLIEPLCVSALNTPMARASAAVFLRVLNDALLGPGFGRWRASDLLLPRTHLGALLPEPAAGWLAKRGAQIRLGTRVAVLASEAQTWRIEGERFDQVVLACPAWEAARLVRGLQLQPALAVDGTRVWVERADALCHEAIATVYAQGPSTLPVDGTSRAGPMIPLRHGPQAPMQFAFDRGRLGGPAGQWALVSSASPTERQALEPLALAQARSQLGLSPLQVIRTVIEKRATFACEPGLVRPGPKVLAGLWAAGDYIDGPYPATLEGAVRHGLAVAMALDAEASPQGMALAAR
jgi:hydroxysqualene dehydroxylase